MTDSDIDSVMCEVDNICEGFRAAWQRGSPRPQFQDYVKEYGDLWGESLVVKLLQLDCELRRGSGETLDAKDYVEKSGRFRDLVHRYFHPHSGSSELATQIGADDGTAQIGCSIASADIEIPATIGRYRVLGRLGHGGFGVVYLAQDDLLGRSVAIKVPHAKYASNATHAALYVREASTVAKLDHPHIVPVYDMGESDEYRCFIVSKYVAGTDLATLLSQHLFPLQETLDLIATVADALHYAHLRGLVHRDVKPGNIVIGLDGMPYLLDFGLALRDEDLGLGPNYVGTPNYMSPEQSRGEGHRVDGTSDIFSLGIVLYEMLSGRLPFSADERKELLQSTTTLSPISPREFDSALPAELERICLRALASRATDRYTTAKEFADDLRFVRQSLQQQIDSVANDGSPKSEMPYVSRERWEPTIFPKGLRAFDQADAEGYLQLVPGPRDRHGIPDSIRFWKSRIEQTDGTQTFSVGVVFGPSGGGKSSFMKAGVLPRLSHAVKVIYLEATPDRTEVQVLEALRFHCPFVSPTSTLAEAFSQIRLNRTSQGPKVVVVLDQFEQWLHSHPDYATTELVRAFRHCNGVNVQAIVIVRDDFWLALTRFMGSVEVPLVPQRNAGIVDKFDVDHAARVLTAFGLALGKFPSQSAMTSQQKEFIRRVVAGLTDEGRVVSVRLAVCAEMMKAKPWTLAGWTHVGGAQGLGVHFLEETFSSRSASPRFRRHEEAARHVLASLLPETSEHIKGGVKEEHELWAVSGYERSPDAFRDLVQLLDRELRLITPVECRDEEIGSSESERPDDRTIGYQLTHDFLVQPIRDWIVRQQRDTRRGRAEICLDDRARIYRTRPESRSLPTFLETLQIVGLTERHRWDEAHRILVRQSLQYYLLRAAMMLVITSIASFLVWHAYQGMQQRHVRIQLAAAVDSVSNLRGSAVPLGIRDLRRFPSSLVRLELEESMSSPLLDSDQQLALKFADATFGRVDLDYFISTIGTLPADEVDNLLSAMEGDPTQAVERLRASARKLDLAQAWREKSRCAWIAFLLGDTHLAAEMVRIDGQSDPIPRTTFVDEISVWHGDWDATIPKLFPLEDFSLRSALCSILGKANLRRQQTKQRMRELALRWYQSPDAVTHGTVGWMFQRLFPQDPLPDVVRSERPLRGHTWYRTTNGVTMVYVPAISAATSTFNAAWKRLEKTGNTPKRDSFWISDSESPERLFVEFCQDPEYPRERVPQRWRGVDPQDRQRSSSWPVAKLPLLDAMMLCNWLSYREGYSPCYEIKSDQSDGKYIEPSNGYRLPFDFEWEHACRAGTSSQYSCGNLLLSDYAVFHADRPAPSRSKLPNRWGIFDMSGNHAEWCLEWHSSKAFLRGGTYSDNTLMAQSGSEGLAVGKEIRHIFTNGSLRLVRSDSSASQSLPSQTLPSTSDK